VGGSYRVREPREDSGKGGEGGPHLWNLQGRGGQWLVCLRGKCSLSQWYEGSDRKFKTGHLPLKKTKRIEEKEEVSCWEEILGVRVVKGNEGGSRENALPSSGSLPPSADIKKGPRRPFATSKAAANQKS